MIKLSSEQPVVDISSTSLKCQALISVVQTFYDSNTFLQDIVIPMCSDRPKGNRDNISLRLLNWVVTNHAQSEGIVFNLANDGSICDTPSTNYYSVINVGESYQRQLSTHGKYLFAPFRRHSRINYNYIGKVSGQQETFLTTIAQLNFFKWALQLGVLKYCVLHRVELELQMKLWKKHQVVKRMYSRTNKGPRHKSV